MLPIGSIKAFLQLYSNQNTKRAYGKTLKVFRGFYREVSKEPYFESHLISKALNNYLKSLHVEKKAKSTIVRSINVLHRYFEWAIDNGFIEINPMRNIERIQLSFKDFKPAYLPNNFNFDDLLKRPDQFSFRGNNARFIIFLLSGFGLKRSEVLNIKLGDIIEIESDNPKLVIRSIRKFRTRMYVLESEAIKELRGFLSRRREYSEYEIDDNDYMLQASEKEKGSQPIDGSTIYRTVSRYMITDEEKKINPSSFRLYNVLTSIYTRKYYELNHMFGMSHKEIAKYKILDAKERIRQESEELIEEIVKERLREEIKKMTG